MDENFLIQVYLYGHVGTIYIKVRNVCYQDIIVLVRSKN
jgi:hypothetical protein